MESEKQLPLRVWRILQLASWLLGVAILLNLFFFPELGIDLFWNFLIPLAPALLVFAVGLWRNICPLASTALFPGHMELSEKKRISTSQAGKLNLAAVFALFLIVPLRHAFFDLDGVATGFLILGLAVLAIVLGSIYEWKSAWCSGLCPVHPVEKLYAVNNRLAFFNAHCNECHNCVIPCPDSTPNFSPFSSRQTSFNKLSGFIMVAAFPGFVWGWFHVPDYDGISEFKQLIEIYGLPLLGSMVTAIAYLILIRFMRKRLRIAIFSALSVSCYYWYRLPALFGFGLFPGDGMLVDLSNSIPEWTTTVAALALCFFLFWWIVFRKNDSKNWIHRPVYANQKKQKR